MKLWALVLGSTLSWIVGASVVAAEPSHAAAAAVDDATAPPRSTSVYARQRQSLRRAGLLRQEVSRRLQNEARSNGAQNLHAVDDLIDLYIALRLDRSLTDSGRLRLAGKVRSRLLRVQERLQKVDSPGDASAGGSAAAAASIEFAADGASPDPTAARESLAEHVSRRTADATAHLSHLVLAQQGLAGPAAAAGALGAQPFPPDYGQDLADLIQTVIAPSTWERNGGPGSIYYFQPRQVLVIRQTGEVHRQVGGVVEDLRQAGN